MAARLLDLTEVNGVAIDRVIALKFPIYYVNHPNKVLWILHQHRQAYELWGTEYGDLEHMEDGHQVRQVIINADNKYLRESRLIYANSKTVSERLKKYNDISAMPLYHPPGGYEKLHCNDFGDFIFYPSRLHEIKRQHLLIEALRYTKTDVKLLLAGTGESEYVQYLNKLIDKYNLRSRIKLLGLISDEEKIKLYSDCCMVFNGPYQEDYGYVTLEAFFSGKPVLTFEDSGGPLEFVTNDETGYVVSPHPEALAEKIDYLYESKSAAKNMGVNGMQLMKKLNVSWDYVIERLLQ